MLATLVAARRTGTMAGRHGCVSPRGAARWFGSPESPERVLPAPGARPQVRSHACCCPAALAAPLRATTLRATLLRIAQTMFIYLNALFFTLIWRAIFLSLFSCS